MLSNQVLLLLPGFHAHRTGMSSHCIIPARQVKQPTHRVLRSLACILPPSGVHNQVTPGTCQVSRLFHWVLHDLVLSLCEQGWAGVCLIAFT